MAEDRRSATMPEQTEAFSRQRPLALPMIYEALGIFPTTSVIEVCSQRILELLATSAAPYGVSMIRAIFVVPPLIELKKCVIAGSQPPLSTDFWTTLSVSPPSNLQHAV